MDTPAAGALPTPYVPGMSGLTIMARGGYATVYRATQDSVGREVAIKVENRTLDNPRDQARFLREAKAAGRMSSHPHVVDLFDVGVTVDQHPYLIMELCDGSYLERMRRQPLGVVEARDVGVKIADALAHSHAAGVLHRDVKPANILYSRFNPAVLADFGLAVLGEMRDSSVTLEVLTPAYAPPEMFRHAAPSSAVDVYALCATLYALMRGRPPRWDHDHNPSLVALMDLFNQPIPDLPGVPVELVDVLRQGMANDPAARPTAEELRDRLAALSLARPAGGTAPVGNGYAGSFPPVSPRLYPPVSPTRDLPEPGDETPTVHTQRKKGSRRRWLFGGFGAVLLLGIGVVSGYALSGAGRASPAPRRAGATAPTLSAAACRTQLPGGGRCPSSVQCLTTQEYQATTPVPCTGRHSWEVFAVGSLPADVPPGDPTAVANDDTVRAVCSYRTFAMTTGRRATEGWTLSVLPPDELAASRGDRTFRCLAGKGPNALNGPVLAQ